MKPALLILAAGMWSRYWWLKQIDPIGPNKEVIIDYSIFDALQAWFSKVVFVIRRDIEQDFKNFFGKKFEKYIEVEYVYQDLSDLPQWFIVPEWRTKPRWTGHALLAAKNAIQWSFALINADDFYGRTSFEEMYKFLSENLSSTTYSLCWYHLKNTVSEHGWVNRGICETENGFLKDIVETKNIQILNNDIWYYSTEQKWNSLSPDTIVSMNFFGFTQSIFAYAEEWFKQFLEQYWREQTSEYYIPFLLDNLIKSNIVKCSVMDTESSRFGVTYQEDKPYVIQSINKLIDQGIYPNNLWNESK